MNFEDELFFKTARSGGKGGQHVNKVETKVTAFWKFLDSEKLTNEQKAVLQTKLKNKINSEGALFVSNETQRTQTGNKQLAVQKLHNLVQQALKPKKPRLKTKPSRSSIEKRIENKKQRSEVKENRRKKHYGD